MSSEPLFTFVVPLYNKEKYIVKTLNALLEQDYENFEILVINDGSTDSSLSLAKSVNSEKIRIISKPNGGVSSARNLGIKEANGEWIIFFDADDEIYSNALSEYVYMINHFPDASVVLSSYDTSYKNFSSKKRYHICNDYFHENIKYYAVGGFLLAWTGVVCAKKDCLISLKGFNEIYTHGEDQDMWYRLVSNYKTIKSDVCTAKYILAAENSADCYAQNRRYAPIAIIRKRNEYRNFYERIFVGCRVFHTALPKGFIKRPIVIKTLFKYIDWAFIYLFFLVYYRIKSLASYYK